MFLRNDRWGTCGDCPQNGLGQKLPELCVNTDRYDHRLGIDALVEHYKYEAERERYESNVRQLVRQIRGLT